MPESFDLIPNVDLLMNIDTLVVPRRSAHPQYLRSLLERQRFRPRRVKLNDLGSVFKP